MNSWPALNSSLRDWKQERFLFSPVFEEGC